MFLDLSKAFDLVHRASIDRALQRHNIQAHSRKIVADLYTNVTTHIHIDGEMSDSIPMSCGVKQGCPLSPLLFNLHVVLDELLDTLTQYIGLEVCGSKQRHCLCRRSSNHGRQ